MARTTARKADPRIHDLALTIESLRLARGVSKRQLALKSGVDPSHLGKFLDGGKAGLSLEQVSNVLQVLSAALAVDKSTQTKPVLVGTISAKGVVSFFGGGVTMPGAFRIDGDFGKLKAGDTVLYDPGEWTEGKMVIVEHEPGDWRLHLCETRNGLRFLVAGDAILFVPERHKIIGMALERRETL